MSADATIIRGDALKLPLRDASVDLIVTSPPYFALRSYRDGGEHFDGQLGSEPTPTDFLRALWAVSDECFRVLKPGGSMWVNLGDKYAGSGGHNNATLAKVKGDGTQAGKATRRDGIDRYNQAADVRTKSLMGLPWRYALGLIQPEFYRATGAFMEGERVTEPKWLLRAEVVWSKSNGLPDPVRDRVRRSHEQWFHFTKQGQGLGPGEVDLWRQAMGIDWMVRDSLSQAIPPAYTQFIGRQLISALEAP